MYINNKSKLQDSHTKGNTITEIHINVLPTLVLDFQYTKTLTCLSACHCSLDAWLSQHCQ